MNTFFSKTDTKLLNVIVQDTIALHADHQTNIPKSMLDINLKDTRISQHIIWSDGQRNQHCLNSKNTFYN